MWLNYNDHLIKSASQIGQLKLIFFQPKAIRIATPFLIATIFLMMLPLFSHADKINKVLTSNEISFVDGSVFLVNDEESLAPPSVILIGFVDYCVGDLITLNALLTGGSGAYSVEWTPPSGPPLPTLQSIVNLGPADLIYNGVWTITAWFNNAPNLQTTVTRTLTVIPLTDIGMDSEGSICSNDVFTSAAIVLNSDDLQWTSSGDGIFLDPNNESGNYIPGLQDIQAGQVTLTLTANSYNSGMCDPAIATVVIRIREAPELQFVITKESDCDDQNGAITIFMPGPVADYTYSLDGISFYANNHFSGLSAATYNIMAADVNGCRAFYPDNPFVLAQMEECNEEFIMPNAFVPLSSNIVNNTFYPIWVNSIPSEYSMLIYNKWGELVFETRNPYAGWDGRSNNELLPAETYAYVVRVKFIHDAGAGFKEQRGSVRLVR